MSADPADRLLRSTEPGEPPALSSVKIEESAKGYPQVRVSLYDGVSEDEVQRLMDLAVTAYEALKRRLGTASPPGTTTTTGSA